MTRKVLVVTVVAVLLVGITSMAYAQRGPGRGMNRGSGWNCPRGYNYQWDYQWGPPGMGPGAGRFGPQTGPGQSMGPGAGRFGPQMGPGQMPQDFQAWQTRRWELRDQIGEKLQERAWLLQQAPVDEDRVAQLNEELAELQTEMWGIGPGGQSRPGPGASGGWNPPAWQ